MTVYDFLDIFNDDCLPCAIYDCTSETEVFSGKFREAMYSDYGDCEVDGVDLDEGTILITITTDEEEDE